MKAICKFIYKREENTKNTIVVWEQDDGTTTYQFYAYWLYPKEKGQPQTSSIKLKEYKDKVLWVSEYYLGEVSMNALSFAIHNKEQFRGKNVKLKTSK
jgi:hypothetical protein